MRISEHFGLQKSQPELDFIDIDPARDYPLFIDPFYLSVRQDKWSQTAYRTIKSFFDHLSNLLQGNRMDEARALFSRLGEPNETCLGLSVGSPRGRGVGPTDAEKIFDEIVSSGAIQTGVLKAIEDSRFFVEGIDRDKISDLTTNIIRKHLIDYTHGQCKLWGIPLSGNVPTGPIWSPLAKKWETHHLDQMLIVNQKAILLVPKAIVSRVKAYTPQQYHQHFVLNFLQEDHLQRRTPLVQVRERKKGPPRVFVTKKSLKEVGGAAFSKEFLLTFTASHPEVFRKFKDVASSRTQPLKNEEFLREEGLEPNICNIIDHLIKELVTCPAGNADATRYHRTVFGILDLLFYPHLIMPEVENEIHEGRKRIDITFMNAATEGFFETIHRVHKVPSSLVMIECKNYGRELANPELDQIAGRFGTNRGQLGFIVCRDLQDFDLFMRRCRDTKQDGRGTVIPILDRDLIEILHKVKAGDNHPEDQLFTNRFRDLIV